MHPQAALHAQNRRWPQNPVRFIPPQLRERLDLSLFLRRVLGVVGGRFGSFLPRWHLSFTKEHLVHSAVLVIIGLVVLTNVTASSSDRGSLLFALFSEAEIEEGVIARPRQTGDPQRTLLGGFIPPAAAGGISEEDIEFELANTLGGNALVENGAPETAETPDVRRSRTLAYSVREGDTPGSIAARFGVSTNTVLWANGIRDGDLIRPGDILVILPVSGVLHTVVSGDDVTSVARRYDAKVEEVIAHNGLSAEGGIRTGQKLIIPDGQIIHLPRRRFARLEDAEEEGAPETPAARPDAAPVPGGGFLRPVAFKGISQYFGWRHTGIDLPDRSRPTVRAAQDGSVEFAGWLGGYGRLVVLNHGRGLKTYYAHLSETYVKSGEAVNRGENVGRVGSSGRSTGSHLHLEVRDHGRPVNPLRYF